MREHKHSSMTGRAGEYAVAAQLVLQQVNVLWPAVDNGFDLMTEEGCRVQVKCAHLLTSKPQYGPRYFFPLPKTKRVPRTDTETQLLKRKPFAQICDFVVFWGIEQNRFWVVPSTLCDKVQGVELGPVSQRRFVGSVKDMRDMIALGYTRAQVAKHYNIQRASVHSFLDSGRDFIDETIVSQMRVCEGRWELITDFVRPAAAPIEAPVVEKEGD